MKELETRIQKSKTTAAALQEPQCKWFMVFLVANPGLQGVSKRLKFCGIESCFLQLMLCTCFGAPEGHSLNHSSTIACLLGCMEWI